MDVLVLIHQEDAGPGVFTAALGAAGVRVEQASLALGRPPSLPLDAYGAVIVMGGDANVDEQDQHPWLADEKVLLARVIARRTPLLGVCLGAQLIAAVAGAEVGPLSGGAEIGWHEVQRTDGADDPLLGAAPQRFRAFQWHGYGFTTPPGATELARGARGAQAFRLAGAPAWGIQFHAEVDAPTVGGWIADYGSSDEARAAGVVPERLAAETAAEIERWNGFGRALCARFLAVAG
jgi:GMP synthase-like glutamine amidotransferase